MRRVFFLLALLPLLLGGALFVLASDGYTASINTPVSITGPDGVCKRVTNNSATGFSEYIPTASTAEWQSFVGHPPSGVSVTSCLPCPAKTVWFRNGDGIYWDGIERYQNIPAVSHGQISRGCSWQHFPGGPIYDDPGCDDPTWSSLYPATTPLYAAAFQCVDGVYFTSNDQWQYSFLQYTCTTGQRPQALCNGGGAYQVRLMNF